MNRNIVIAALILGAVVLVGYLLQTMPSKTSQKEQVAEQSPSPVSGEVFAVYTGELPCADCEGISVVLTLNKDETYTMSNVYKGRDVNPFIEKGKWYVLKGAADNENATVYQLISSAEDSSKTNYEVEGNQLISLDADMKRIESPFNTSLTKKTE